MPSKTFHGVTLWGVPRFHRAETAAPAPAVAVDAASEETGKEWVNRLQTYSFTLGQGEKKKLPGKTKRPDVPEICH